MKIESQYFIFQGPRDAILGRPRGATRCATSHVCMENALWSQYTIRSTTIYKTLLVINEICRYLNKFQSQILTCEFIELKLIGPISSWIQRRSWRRFGRHSRPWWILIYKLEKIQEDWKKFS